jgi:hypothetical protein
MMKILSEIPGGSARGDSALKNHELIFFGFLKKYQLILYKFKVKCGR